MIWDELTSREIDRLDRNTPVVLPITATEQHGPHLPLATDRFIGEFIAKKLNESISDQVLILPSVSVGYSEHHMDFAGTLTQTHKSFIQQVAGIIESAIRHGFTRILLLNSHGGNQAVGQVITERVGSQNPGIHITLATWWQLAANELKEITETGQGGVGHAGEFETSLMLFIAPHLVRKKYIEQGTNTATFSWAEGDMLRAPQASYYQSMKVKAPNGVFGNPTFASKEKGEKIIERILSTLEQMVLDLSATGN